MGRLSLKTVQENCEQQGWQLLSNKYINLTTQMEFQCPEGHKVLMTYDHFRKNPICPICARQHLDVKDAIQSVPKKAGVKRTLALDQATHTSGWSIYDGTDLIKYGKFAAINDEDIDRRIADVKNYLINMLDFWKPDFVYLEDIQLQQFGPKSSNNIQGVTTYKGLAKLQGVLINTLLENGYEYHIVHTGTWREVCGIKGKSRTDRKKSAQLLVKKLYGVNVTQDEADAICIGNYATKKKKENATLISWD